MNHARNNHNRSRLQALSTLSEVWGQLYIFSSAIPFQRINWEEALSERIEVIGENIPKAELRRSVASLLNEAQDPFAYLAVREFGRKPINDRSPVPLLRVLDRNWGYLDLRQPQIGSEQFLRESLKATRRRHNRLPVNVILDCRWLKEPLAGSNILAQFNALAEDTSRTGYLIRQHVGWNEDNDPTRPYEHSWKWMENQGEITTGIDSRYALHRLGPAKRFVILVNNRSYPPLLQTLYALQSSGHAAVLWEQSGPTTFHTHEARFGSNLGFHFSTNLYPSSEGWCLAPADWVSTIPVSIRTISALGNLALQNAAKAARKRRWTATPPHPLPLNNVEREDGFQTNLVTAPRRLASFIKLWYIIRTFHPHDERTRARWETVLPRWIPRIDAARTEVQYRREIELALSTLADGHVLLRDTGRRISHLYVPDLSIRKVGRKLLVLGGTIRTLPPPTPLRRGDEIVRFDGLLLRDVVKKWKPQISASTPHSRDRSLWRKLLAGRKNSVLSLSIRRGRSIRQISLMRRLRVGTRKLVSEEATIRMVGANVGYIDLSRIMNEKLISSAMRRMSSARALILDLRGYPGFFMTFSLVSRLCDRPTLSPLYSIPVIAARMGVCERVFEYVVLPESAVYRGALIVLIDECTQSRAEDICMYLRYAKRAVFVGSTTAGTNGNTAHIRLAGAQTLVFTGMEVRWPDGSLFQGKGIEPDIPIRASLRAIIKGRDEVLDAAVHLADSIGTVSFGQVAIYAEDMGLGSS